jgi:hypothetical protein
VPVTFAFIKSECFIDLAEPYADRRDVHNASRQAGQGAVGAEQRREGLDDHHRRDEVILEQFRASIPRAARPCCSGLPSVRRFWLGHPESAAKSAPSAKQAADLEEAIAAVPLGQKYTQDAAGSNSPWVAQFAAFRAGLHRGNV